MRIFVGIAPTLEVKAGLTAALSGVALPGRSTPVENWHFTLRFIGETDPVSVDRLLGGLDESDLGGPFTLTLGSLGAFPRPSRATVVWVGVDRGALEFSNLAVELDLVADRVGLGIEERPFVPHLSLARIRPPEDVSGLLNDIPIPRMRMQVSELAVFESRLGEGAPVYEVVETITL